MAKEDQYGVWSMAKEDQYGVWGMEYGVWQRKTSMEYGVWSMEYGKGRRVWSMYYRSSIHGLTQTVLFLLRFFFQRTQCNNTRVAVAASSSVESSAIFLFVGRQTTQVTVRSTLFVTALI